MANVSIFEPTTKQWYYQTSTGAVPTQRDRSCVVGSSAGADGSFEIFMYRGQYGAGTFTSPSHNVGLDEVYVLSIPAFQWFKADYTSSDPRMLDTCHGMGRQLLTVGGINSSASSFQDAIKDADKFQQGIKAFDMTALKWTDSLDSSVPKYDVPTVIKTYYSSAGGEPASWDMVALHAILNGTASYGTPAEPNSSSSLSKSNTGPIVGGVVGGFGGLA